MRIVGFADTPMTARRFDLDQVETAERLSDAEARGWVTHPTFADLHGWSLTVQGRAENERQLAAEIDHTDGVDEVREVYYAFFPLNTRLQRACANWQLRPTVGDRLVANDHSDPSWDAGILDELSAINRRLEPLAGRLGNVLTRFSGALERVRAGDGGWADRTDIDSCHRVWVELHGGLIATLGLDRHTELWTPPPTRSATAEATSTA